MDTSLNHPWTKIVHIVPPVDSYVNGQSNYFNCFVCANVTIFKSEKQVPGRPQTFKYSHKSLGLSLSTWVGLEQFNLDLGTNG